MDLEIPNLPQIEIYTTKFSILKKVFNSTPEHIMKANFCFNSKKRQVDMTFNLTFKDGEMAGGKSYRFQFPLCIHKGRSVWQKLQLGDKSPKEQRKKSKPTPYQAIEVKLMLQLCLQCLK